MKIIKKPIVVEAVQIQGATKNKNNEGYFPIINEPFPSWFVQGMVEGVIRTYKENLSVFAPEGTMSCGIGDYIIRGVQGEIYPCKEEVFNESYDKVEPITSKEVF